MNNNIPQYSDLAHHWKLDKDIVFLNHGSFGATPTYISEQQTRYRDIMEREPVDFFVNQWPVLLDRSKKKLAEFVNADPDDLVFVQNTTTGVNQVLNSFLFEPGDEWLVSSHAYGACMLAMKHFCERNKIRLNVIEIPFPVEDDQQILKALQDKITDRTKLALIDHVSSATGMVFPIKKIVDFLRENGVCSLVDGAHAPGMVYLDIRHLNPDFYVANCHKWICAPKGSAFMYVKPDWKHFIKPLIISHYNDTDEGGSSHWANQFMWDGTHDFSAYFCVGDTLDYIEKLHPDGWEGVMNSNHKLVWNAGNLIAEKLGFDLPLRENYIGSILTLPMPDGEEGFPKFNETPPLKQKLYEKYQIQVGKPLIRKIAHQGKSG
ncbi:MAG TPA: aminotransferase [Saprospirales bacterium]|nr:aminotransferase [Saprospirales bacterium]